jgi:hypothetical protein
VDPLGNPASLAGRGLPGIACGRNMPALRGGEEVEVLGGPCREVLCEQCCSPGQQEALLAGSAKNILATSGTGRAPGVPYADAVTQRKNRW